MITPISTYTPHVFWYVRNHMTTPCVKSDIWTAGAVSVRYRHKIVTVPGGTAAFVLSLEERWRTSFGFKGVASSYIRGAVTFLETYDVCPQPVDDDVLVHEEVLSGECTSSE